MPLFTRPPNYKSLSEFSDAEIAANREDGRRYEAETGQKMHAPGWCDCYPECYRQADADDAREAESELWQANTARLAGVWPLRGKP